MADGFFACAVDAGSDLSILLHEALHLNATDRAQLVEQSDALESAHHAAAVGGETATPAASDDTDLHYLCYVKSANDHVWELDGRRKGPLDRGQLDADDDMLSEKALDLGVRAFLKRAGESGPGDLRFSLIALCPSLE